MGNRRRSSTAGGGALERLGRGDGEAPRDLLYSVLDRKMRMVAQWLRAWERGVSRGEWNEEDEGILYRWRGGAGREGDSRIPEGEDLLVPAMEVPGNVND